MRLFASDKKSLTFKAKNESINAKPDSLAEFDHLAGLI